MGILDHRKTWEFQLNAPPSRCVEAFASVFTGERGGGPLMARAKWQVQSRGSGAVAIYRGRAGLAAGLTMMSSRASSEQDLALGSEITFEVESLDTGAVSCSMWLSSRGTAFGLTADGRFFRPYMRRVQASLLEVDPRMVVRTG